MKLTCEFSEVYVESTPEQLVLREQALNILAEWLREFVREKRAREAQAEQIGEQA